MPFRLAPFFLRMIRGGSVLGLLAWAFLLLGAAPVRCGLCNRAIQGQYTVYTKTNGRQIPVCATCNATAPKCPLCGTPHRDPIYPKEPALCRDCWRTAVKCSVCQRTQLAGYSTYKLDGGATEHRVCPTCMQTARRCAHCGVPFANQDLRLFPSGVTWCSRCIKDALICDACKCPIQGKYFTLQYQKGQWCDTCYSKYEKCDFCGRPMNRTAAHMPDGRHICSLCFVSGLQGEEPIKAIATEVEPLFEEFLGVPIRMVPVRVTGIDGLVAASGAEVEPGKDTSGKPLPMSNEVGLFVWRENKREVLILNHLPADMAWETIAHELAHAWQTQYYPNCEDWMLIEGFAQWFAEQVCVKKQKVEGLQRLRERQDDYGKAYRGVAALIAAEGVSGVKAALRSGKLPPKYLE